MSIKCEDVGADQRRIAISGRLDVSGTKVIAPQLADFIATPRKHIIVDLTALEFLTSIGIRALIESGKVVRNRGGKMVLVADGDSIVIMSLRATGTDQLIPTYKTLAEAQKALAT